MVEADETPAIPEHIYKSRIQLVQAHLDDHGLEIGVLFDPEELYWLTGYQTVGYFTFQALVLTRDGTTVLISRRVNAGLAHANRLIDVFVAIEDTQDPVMVLSEAIAARAGRHDPIGLQTQSWYLTVDQYRRLEVELDADRLRVWNDSITPHRLIKNEWELTLIRRAAHAALDSLEAAYMEVSPGVTENDVAAAMHAAGIRAGSEYLGHPPLVVAGKRTALCFATWQRHAVKPGDVVLLEAAGCVDRYHAMVARSVVVGEPSAEQRRVAETILAVLETAIETMRPGVRAGEVDRAARRKADKAGLGAYFGHRVGYGIGIGFPPNWSEGHIYAIRPESELVLAPGMTFHIVPTLFTPTFGMCFSESVLVTQSGCEVLTPCARELWVK